MPKAAAIAAELDIDDGDLSNMRSGKRPVSLRRLRPFQEYGPSALAFCAKFLEPVDLSQYAEAVLVFCTRLLAPIGFHARPIKGPTRQDIVEIDHDAMQSVAMGREHRYRVAEERYGWTRAQVDEALRSNK